MSVAYTGSLLETETHSRYFKQLVDGPTRLSPPRILDVLITNILEVRDLLKWKNKSKEKQITNKLGML